MVDVICVAHLLLQMHIIVNGSKDIFLCNVLWNQVVDISAHSLLKRLLVGASFFQDRSQGRVIY